MDRDYAEARLYEGLLHFQQQRYDAVIQCLSPAVFPLDIGLLAAAHAQEGSLSRAAGVSRYFINSRGGDMSLPADVIGHQHARGRILVDAGWMAMFRDRGTATQAVDQGYGLVCDVDGRAIPGLIMASTSQEHGVIGMRPNGGAQLPDLAVGARLRILPNHACATASQFASYTVIPADAGAPIVQWPRFGGWSGQDRADAI